MSEPGVPRLVGDRRNPGRGDLQRARLIDAVLDLLRTTSIAELSVIQIAKHAGVTRPVFYFYFESKYVVLAASLSQAWAEFDAARTLTDQLDFSQPLELVRCLTREAIEIWSRHHTLLAAVVEARSSDAQLARMWDELTAQTERKVSHFIEILKVAGIVRPASEDLPGLVDALLGMTVWLLLKAGPTIASADREELVEVISSVWVASVWGVPPGSETTAGKTVSVVHGGPRAT